MNTVYYLNIDYKSYDMKISLSFIIPFSLLILAGQDAKSQSIPEQYITEAFENNLVLKEKKITLEKSLIALQEARSFYLPTTSFEGQYTLAKGGRSIDIPVGDLVNPVYKTLNQLTNSNSFPTITNVSEQLNPNNFYDVRIRTSMPLFNADLKINREIKQQQITLRQTEVDVYKRELLRDLKMAYYNYILAGKAIDIYQNALEVVQQNLKINQSLLKNGKGLPAYVSRAESEVKSVESQLQTARNDQQNAKAYFNFLLNKPLNDLVIENNIVLVETQLPVSETASDNIQNREELKTLNLAKEINQDVLKMNRSYRTPRVNAFVDLAAQGFDFKVNNKSFFYLAGLQVQIPLYAGNRNNYKIQQTLLDQKALDINTASTKQQLQLAAQISRNNIITTYNKYLSTVKQEEAAQKYFKLIDRGFSEGVNSFIEFLDARNQLTNTSLQVNITKYRVLSALADFERQTASYVIK